MAECRVHLYTIMALPECQMQKLNARFSGLVSDPAMGTGTPHDVRQRQHKASCNLLFAVTCATDKFRNNRVDSRLTTHENAKCLRGSGAHDNTCRVPD